ncbi:response regulator [Mucilaginibacter daejeonensis]|uniref:hybrid sensor histidine kinase/response regulator transcription factor n=1 Tax=Mucilaginibacter daejeonensis TaxID=398049 RepID=UPI001D170D93|nr:two-component regulator propeller domain-containing protein [Mucilaginibacter daejeonensis]UEG54993.1 response regulator [Mucilaginibacter daejeonensis]
MSDLTIFYRVIRLVLIALLVPLCVVAQTPELRFEQMTSENGLPQNTIHGISKDKYGFMWFGTWSGLCRFDGYKFRIYRYDPADKNSIINSRIHNVITDKNGDLWIETFDTNIICRYNYQHDNFERYPRKAIAPMLLTLLNHRTHCRNVEFIYGNTKWEMDDEANALLETDLRTGIRKPRLSDRMDRWSLNDSYVTDIYLDDNQLFWVGTFSNGFNKANLKGKPFHTHYQHSAGSTSVADDIVRSITEDKFGNRWIGTRDKGVIMVRKDHSTLQFRAVHKDSSTLSSDLIKTVFSDSKGRTWVGTKKGLDRYDPTNGQFKHRRIDLPPNLSVYGVMEDEGHDLWISTWGGIYQYVTATNKLKFFDPAKTLASSHVVTILKDHRKQLWVGTEGGGVSVLKLNKAGELETVRYLYHDDGNKNSLSDDRVYSIFEDAERFIWIGTGNGLERFDQQKGTFKHFSVSPNGLSNATIAGITEDDNSNIWLSHKRGISRINKRTFAVRNYSAHDGLQSNEFSDGAVFKSPTGMLYFGGNRGYNTFYPDSIRDDHTISPIVLTELQVLNIPVEVGKEVNGRVLLSKPLYLNNEIALDHKDKSIAIEFAALDYASPKGNRYAYMLEGFDKDWIYTDASRRVATYSNLSSGNYTFKVRAANSDGIWNPQPRVLTIKVYPPWWASGWAYLAYVIIAALILRAVYIYFRRFIGLKAKLGYEALVHQKELELHQSKIEFFTNISHEIKTPLSLILAPIEQLKEQIGDDPKASGHLQTMGANGSRLLKLIDQLLDIRRLESGHEVLRKEQTEIIGFIEQVISSFKRFAADKNIALELVTDIRKLYISCDRDKVEKTIVNLLSNSLKFTNSGGAIQVGLDVVRTGTKSEVQITVTDNGCGIAQQDQERVFKPFQQAGALNRGGTGLGLSYSRALIELHGGTITVASDQANDGSRYTRFTVTIPTVVYSEDELLNREVNEEASAQIELPDTSDALPMPVNERVDIDGRLPLILLAEDNYELRKYLKSCFVDNYQILEAENGLQALDLSRQHLPDLIISDVMMPEMDGLEFCRRIKGDAYTSHVPVILLTARAPIEYQIEGIETGANDYMTKPFNVRLLSLKMRNLLLEQQKLRDKYKAKVVIQAQVNDAVSPDERLLDRLVRYIDERISDTDLGVDDLCNEVGMSRSQLYRKLKAISGLTVADMIRSIRLKRSQVLLKDSRYNVSEVAYMVGFNDVDYFRKCFKAEFAVSPSEFVKASSMADGVK